LELLLWEKKERSAISLKAVSNYHDDFLNGALNEIETTRGTENSDFDDYNISLNGSYRFASLTFHAALAVTRIPSPQFEQSPKSLYFEFIGFNWKITPHLSLILQDLQYSSIFPDDKSEPSMSRDLNELTIGSRIQFYKSMTLECGFVENAFYLGPPGIDFAYFITVQTVF
ncbi:MAG: DUF3187 family protein, partial [SAR324 cluster bacterium]|nr:DUF3187 family protein [SAR324 cluster bacterium]